MIFNNYPEIIIASSKLSDGNMSTIKGNTATSVKNREKFLKKFGLKLNQVINMYLQHEDKIVVVSRNDMGKGAYDSKKGIVSDGIITDQNKLVLMATSADCLPISFYDPKKRVIALVHGSKKNLESKILDNTISTFKNSFQSDLTDLKVFIGPSIGPCCYYTDLWSYTENKLKKLGLLRKNIYNSKKCTYHDRYFFSHRRSENTKTPEGRFVTILGLR